MANYKWKITYRLMASMSICGMKEQKFEDYKEMTKNLGMICMISWDVFVSTKVKGKWEHSRTINCHTSPVE